MNKKILAILALLIVATSIGAVSAFDLSDLFGGAQNETVTIDGVDFNYMILISARNIPTIGNCKACNYILFFRSGIRAFDIHINILSTRR